MNKSEIDISYTSAQKFFENSRYNTWSIEQAPILVGINIRSPENIGGLIRLAGTIGCKQVIFASDKENHKIAKIKKTATTGFNNVDWKFTELDNWINDIPKNYKIIALETTKYAKNIYSHTFDSKTVILVGDERYGIDNNSLKQCHKHLYIPMNGPVKSLNVVQAATIGLFEILRSNIII